MHAERAACLPARRVCCAPLGAAGACAAAAPPCTAARAARAGGPPIVRSDVTSLICAGTGTPARGASDQDDTPAHPLIMQDLVRACAPFLSVRCCAATCTARSRLPAPPANVLPSALGWWDCGWRRVPGEPLCGPRAGARHRAGQARHVPECRGRRRGGQRGRGRLMAAPYVGTLSLAAHSKTARPLCAPRPRRPFRIAA